MSELETVDGPKTNLMPFPSFSLFHINCLTQVARSFARSPQRAGQKIFYDYQKISSNLQDTNRASDPTRREKIKFLLLFRVVFAFHPLFFSKSCPVNVLALTPVLKACILSVATNPRFAWTKAWMKTRNNGFVSLFQLKCWSRCWNLRIWRGM